jgi:hypothetical protein
MAEQAQGTQVLQVALSPAFHYRKNVIGVPERLARKPCESPLGEKPLPVGPARAPQLPIGGAGVDAADRAKSAVPQQNLLAKVPGVGAEAPFVDTPIRTEGKAPRWDFQTAPAAERAAIRPFRQSGAIGEAAGHGPGGAQGRHNIFIIKCLKRSRWGESVEVGKSPL